MAEMILVAQPDGSVDAVSQRWCVYTGQSHAQATGSGWAAALHSDDAARVLARWGEAVRNGQPCDVECRIKGVDGAHRWFQLQSSPIADAQGRIVQWVGTAVDVDDQQRVAKRQRLLAEASRVFAEATIDRQAVLGALARVADMLYESAVIVTRDADGEQLDPVVIHDPAPILDVHRELLAAHPFRVGEGLIGRVVQTGEPILIPHVKLSTLEPLAKPEHRPFMGRIAPRSIVIVPLRARGVVLGAVAAGQQGSGRPFSAADQMFLQDLADRAALALDNARLYEAEQVARHDAERAADRIARLQAVTAALGSALDPAQVADVIISTGLVTLGARAGSVGLLVERGTKVEIVREVEQIPDGVARWTEMLRAVGYPAEEVAGRRRVSIDAPVPLVDAVRTGIPVWLDGSTDWAARYPSVVTAFAAIGYGASAVLPLVVEGRTIGGLRLTFVEERTFSEEDRSLMVALALQCAQALERARLYEAEQRARDAAEVAVQARDEFLSVAAHELKTPLTSIRLGVQILRRRLEAGRARDVGSLRELLRHADEQTDHLVDLIGRLLDISRIEAGKLLLDPRVVDLVPIVERAVATSRATAARHRIVVDHPPTLPARVDALRLSQVLTNLLDNAVKFSPPESQIDVELSQPVPETVRLMVRDRGVGIPPDRRVGIFERFYQAHAKGHSGGMGLGLYISLQIVELHGGRIAVEHPEDGGTRFVVMLPRGDLATTG